MLLVFTIKPVIAYLRYSIRHLPQKHFQLHVTPFSSRQVLRDKYTSKGVSLMLTSCMDFCGKLREMPSAHPVLTVLPVFSRPLSTLSQQHLPIPRAALLIVRATWQVQREADLNGSISLDYQLSSDFIFCCSRLGRCYRQDLFQPHSSLFTQLG